MRRARCNRSDARIMAAPLAHAGSKQGEMFPARPQNLVVSSYPTVIDTPVSSPTLPALSFEYSHVIA